MEVLNNGSDNQSANCAEYSCSEQEYTNGHTLVPHIDGSLNHGDGRRHPAFSTQITHEKPEDAEVEVECEEEAHACCEDAQHRHAHADVRLDLWVLLLVAI